MGVFNGHGSRQYSSYANLDMIRAENTLPIDQNIYDLPSLLLFRKKLN